MTFTIPDEALDTHIGVLGKTGSGKTFTARGMVERLLDAQRQVVIIDPTGAWYGLRSIYPVPIFGGEHGDVAITDQSGYAVAETIISHGTSAIIDLSGLARQSGAAMRRFMTAFVARLKDRDRGALWLVIDEADEFLPQVLSPDMTHLFGDLKWIVRRGRVNGWRVMMITQRPQDIAKSVLTQIGTLVAHRLTAPQDRKAVEEWVKGHADPEEAKAVLSSLASLKQGEAWVWSPDHDLLERAMMPPIKSFDSGATPDADSGAVAQPALAAIDMTAIRATLEAGVPAKQKRSVCDFEQVGVSAQVSGADAAELAALRAERDEWTVERGVGQQQLNDLANQNTRLIEELDACATAMERLTIAAERARRAIAVDPDLETGCADDKLPGSAEQWRIAADRIAAPAPKSVPQPIPHLRPDEKATVGGLSKPLPPGERAVLIAAVQYGGVDRDQLSVLTGYKRSSRDAYIARLREKGLVEVAGQTVRPLSGARDALGSEYEPLPTGAALRQYWMERLPPGESAILGVLAEAFPLAVARSDLDERTGYKRSSRDAYIQRLKARRLVETTGSDVRASGGLFP